MIKKNTKENNNMNPVVKYIIIALTTIGVAGASIFMVYRSNEVKQASQVAEVQSGVDVSLLNDKSGQETTDVDNLAKELYENYKDQLKEGTTLEDWVKQFKIYYESLNDETEALNSCLNYFAPDTILPGDVEDPESMEVKVDEEDAAIVTAEMLGNDDATEEEIVSIEATEATSEASITDANTDVVTQNTHEYEIEYRDTAETMYAVKGVNVRKGPATDYDKVRTLSVNEKIEVIGIVSEVDGEETYWVVFKDADGNQLFVSGAYVDTKPITTSTSSSNNTGSSNNTSSSQTSSGQTSSTQSNNSSQSDAEKAAEIAERLKGLGGTIPAPTIDGNNATGQSTGGINWGN